MKFLIAAAVVIGVIVLIVIKVNEEKIPSLDFNDADGKTTFIVDTLSDSGKKYGVLFYFTKEGALDSSVLSKCVSDYKSLMHSRYHPVFIYADATKEEAVKFQKENDFPVLFDPDMALGAALNVKRIAVFVYDESMTVKMRIDQEGFPGGKTPKVHLAVKLGY